MNKCKKLEKELLFKNNIKEITSISLDSEYKINDNELIGNFIINGDYKIHEVSINREKFNFKIPFKEKIEKDVDKESVKLEITNFEYDYRKDELRVNIEYEVVGDRKDVIIFDDEESLDDFLKTREVEIIDTRLEDIKEEIDEIKEIEEIKEDIKEDNQENKEIFEHISLDRNNEEIKADEIISKIDKPKDNFITYQIYKLKETDTLESIVLKYKISVEDLKEYNDLSNLNVNDKIIIPYYE